MKVQVIINPRARRGRINRIESVVKKKFAGHRTEIKRTEYPGHATEIAHRACDEGVDIIVAVGGDGTVNEIINGIVNSDVALGIIPAGTANDLAFCHRIPEDIEKACDIINERHLRSIDAICVNDWYFTTVGGIGLPCDTVSITESIKSRPVLGRLLTGTFGSRLYLFGLVCAFIKNIRGSNPICISNGAFTFKANALSLIVGNQAFLGANFHVLPGAVNNDGRFDVFLINKCGNLLRLSGSVFGTLNASHITKKNVEIFQSREITIDSSRELAFFGDGQISQAGTRFNISIIPGAVKLLVP